MQHLVDATRRAVGEKNWYAALTLALTLPDICGKLERKLEGRERYIDWFNRYVRQRYTMQHQVEQHVFVSGNDCYALRCAFLHQGEFDLSGQNARNALRRFYICKPDRAPFVHCNQDRDVLQLNVDIFCVDICDGVEQWLRDVSADPAIQARIRALGKLGENPIDFITAYDGQLPV